MFKEFKDFTNKINIMNLAVGVIIGGAFQKIINSLVSDIVMPLISTVIGKVDFADMILNIGSVSIKYGNFLAEVINFLIIAFSVFLFIKYLNSLDKQLDKVKFGDFEKIAKKLDKKGKFRKKKSKKEPEPTVKLCPFCYSEINIKATRCPNCTSILEEDKREENIEGEQLKIEE